MEKEKKYFCCDNKTLAIALNYVGFSYYRFGEQGNYSYSFEDSENFQEALDTLNKLRKKNNKYKK